MDRLEYLVLPLSEIVESPELLSLAKTKIDKIASSLTEHLNTKVSEGWELVTIYATMGNGFAVFKKQKP